MKELGSVVRKHGVSVERNTNHQIVWNRLKDS